MANGTYEIAIFEREGTFRARLTRNISGDPALDDLESEEYSSLSEALFDLGDLAQDVGF